MTFIEHLKLLQRMDALIARKGTGSVKEFSTLLDVSRSSLFNYLDTLRTLGGEIEFCDFRKSYYYVDNQRPQLPIISKSNSDDYYGGKTFSNFFQGSPKFLDWHVSPLYQVERQKEKLNTGYSASFMLEY